MQWHLDSRKADLSAFAALLRLATIHAALVLLS